MNKHYLIIGSSAAAIGVMSKLRDLDPTGRITCVTAEQEMPYNRCLLADFLAGKKVETEVRTKSAAFFTEKNITLRLALRVVNLDSVAQAVTLFSGEKLGYDKLFLGMGKSAFVPPVPGVSVQGVFPFFDFKDARLIDEYLKNNQVKQAVVIGAGLTGLECADALQARGVSVTVIERTDKLLSNVVDEQGAAFLEKRMHDHGVVLYKNVSVSEIIQQHERVSGVALTDETVIPAQLVIFATGGRTNNALVREAGLTMLDQGVWVDSHMQTSNETIYAGGDLCMVNDLLTEKPVQNCLWSDAVQQGMVAAHGMAGIERKYPGVLLISASHLFGLSFASCGPVNQHAGFKALLKQEDDFYHCFIMQEDRLKAFLMIGQVANLGMLRKALLEKKEAHVSTHAS